MYQNTQRKKKGEYNGIKIMMKCILIDKKLLEKVSAEAKGAPRLRMNYNFHQSLDDKCHRFLNAVEPGTKVEIHRHPTKDETFVLLRGRVRVNIYNDDGALIESVVLCPEEGLYGVDIVPHEVEGVLSVKR